MTMTTTTLASKALFVGINRHADACINDLSGARWDAVALLSRLELGVPEDVLALTELAVPWTRGDLLALRSMGVTTEEQLLAADQSGLRNALGERLHRGGRQKRGLPPSPAAHREQGLRTISLGEQTTSVSKDHSDFLRVR
jgi:hypothetical protein